MGGGSNQGLPVGASRISSRQWTLSGLPRVRSITMKGPPPPTAASTTASIWAGVPTPSTSSRTASAQ